jgi:hypothetical protein
MPPNDSLKDDISATEAAHSGRTLRPFVASAAPLRPLLASSPLACQSHPVGERSFWNELYASTTGPGLSWNGCMRTTNEKR